MKTITPVQKSNQQEKAEKLQGLISLLLACLLLILPLASCGIGEQSDGGDQSSATSGVMSEETDPLEEALTAVRAEADWGGKEFGLLFTDRFGYAEEVQAVANMTESSGSGVINNAVWERNSLFEEYGNLDFVIIPIDTDNATDSIRREVQASTGDFLLVTQPTSYTANLATTGILYSYLDLEIDYDQEWWDAGTLDFALGGRVFFMNGPFNTIDDDVTYLMTFNKKLHTEYKLDDPYDLVRSGDWTMETFKSTVQGRATDNGDGVWDAQDTYGLAAGGSMDTFFYAADLKYVNSSRDLDEPELAMDQADMEKALNMLAMTREVIQDPNTSIMGTDSFSVFLEGRAFYFTEAASYLRGLNASMEDEYGVIPVPKYNKQQEHHASWSHSIGSTLSMPATVGEQDTEAFAKVLELYVILSQKLVRPAYYEVMLTTRNVRDADSAEMLDLIFNHRVYDMAMYFGELGMSEIFSASAVATDKFSSTYKRASSNFDKRVSKILDNLSKAS